MSMAQYCIIGTDAKIGMPAALARYIDALRADIDALEQSANWNEKAYLEKAETDKKTETTGIYNEAVADMGTTKTVCIRDVVGSELCISSSSGQRVFNSLLSAVSQGYNVCISFENIKSLSPTFLDSAIGRLYSDRNHEYIDKKLSFVNISPGRRLIVERAIREAKEYYGDPEGYRARMNEIFADDRCD